MWKFTKLFVFLAVLSLVFFGCQHQSAKAYSYHPAGFYYQLLSFTDDSSQYHAGNIALVNAVFKTQSDSVFWDSYNDLNNSLFIHLDSNSTNQFHRFVSTCTELDSASMLIKVHTFFSQQFKSDSLPFFSKGDSVVKINFKIQQILSPSDFEKLKTNLRREEQNRIAGFFKSDQDQEAASDPSGFYWIERPEINTGQSIEPGDVVQIAYEGSFLNGRFLERSSADFEFIYGTPDQLLKGLNYVIGTLKTGQTSKILLPSRLAFGEDGSSNGIVPPCTPLIYKIKIIDVKKPK